MNGLEHGYGARGTGHVCTRCDGQRTKEKDDSKFAHKHSARRARLMCNVRKLIAEMKMRMRGHKTSEESLSFIWNRDSPALSRGQSSFIENITQTTVF